MCAAVFALTQTCADARPERCLVRVATIAPRRAVCAALRAARRGQAHLSRARPVYALCVLCVLLGVVVDRQLLHRSVVRLRRLSSSRPLSSASPSNVSLPRVYLISTLYASSYSASRLSELRQTMVRNLHLPISYRLVSEADASLPGSLPSPHPSIFPVSAPIGYSTLFAHINALPRGAVAALAHADIYFDHSLLCAAVLRPGVVLALSRHPAPDCPAASGHGHTGWEPHNFCAGYHPVRHASHDVFIVRVPVPQDVVHTLRSLPVNQFGAENVVLWAFKKAGWKIVNACENVHAFHLHCDVEQRAQSARDHAGSVADKQNRFAGADQWGWVHPREWATNTVGDCVEFGMNVARRGS